MTDLAKITLTYWITVQRIRRLPMTPTARARVLADVEVMYRAERAEIQHPPMVGRMLGRNRNHR